MKKYEFNAINLIAEAFDEHKINYRVASGGNQEEIQAGFPIDCGPSVVLKFISRDNDNDVAVRIFGLVRNIPMKKRLRIMEACNILNAKVRYIKFYIDTDGDINVEYDFPVKTDDCCVGEMAVEIFIRIMRIMDAEYPLFMKALYTEDALQPRENAEEESHEEENNDASESSLADRRSLSELLRALRSDAGEGEDA